MQVLWIQDNMSDESRDYMFMERWRRCDGHKRVSCTGRIRVVMTVEYSCIQSRDISFEVFETEIASLQLITHFTYFNYVWHWRWDMPIIRALIFTSDLWTCCARLVGMGLDEIKCDHFIVVRSISLMWGEKIIDVQTCWLIYPSLLYCILHWPFSWWHILLMQLCLAEVPMFLLNYIFLRKI